VTIGGSFAWAFRTGVPVVPAVADGSHDTIVIVCGRRLARALGSQRLRIQVFPIVLAPYDLITSHTAPPDALGDHRRIPASTRLHALRPMQQTMRKLWLHVTKRCQLPSRRQWTACMHCTPIQ
jgi:1-acyl-sn-glycerol-3-phosphate acyltransferase